jgi:hypothetical protein
VKRGREGGREGEGGMKDRKQHFCIEDEKETRTTRDGWDGDEVLGFLAHFSSLLWSFCLSLFIRSVHIHTHVHPTFCCFPLSSNYTLVERNIAPLQAS